MAKGIDIKDKEFIKKSLTSLKEQLDRIVEYIEENPWQKMEADTRSEEFKFQTALFDNHTKWLKLYMEMSGVYDFYEEAMKNRETENNVRQGHIENPVMDMLKDDNFVESLKNLK